MSRVVKKDEADRLVQYEEISQESKEIVEYKEIGQKLGLLHYIINWF